MDNKIFKNGRTWVEDTSFWQDMLFFQHACKSVHGPLQIHQVSPISEVFLFCCESTRFWISCSYQADEVSNVHYSLCMHKVTLSCSLVHFQEINSPFRINSLPFNPCLSYTYKSMVRLCTNIGVYSSIPSKLYKKILPTPS
jgi:hypothetical protein